MTAKRIARPVGTVLGLLLSCPVVVAADPSTGSWPGWRGKDRAGISQDQGLLKEWPKGGPKLLWTFEAAGFGYGQPAIVGEQMFILGKDDEGEFIKKLSLDGKEVKRAQLDKGENSYDTGWGGGPRSTPTIDGDRIFALSSDGRLVCFDRGGLTEKWAKHLVSDLGGKTPHWGYAESPLVDGDKVVVTPGGKNLVVALNKNDGATIWTSTGIEEGAHYSSLVPMDVSGKRTYVTQAAKHFFGVDADNGKLIWKSAELERRIAVIPTPVVSDNCAYATAGYGAGGECVEVNGSGGSLAAKTVYANKNMINHHGGVVLLDGYVYGHSDAERRREAGKWVCQKLSDGSVASTFDASKVGKGSITYADGRFYLYEQKIGGSCVLAEASPTGWTERGRLKLPKNSSLERGGRKAGEIWAHPVVAGGKLYLRDLDLLYCYDVKGK